MSSSKVTRYTHLEYSKIGVYTYSLNKWWSEAELNCRHEDFQSSALPTELSDQAELILAQA